MQINSLWNGDNIGGVAKIELAFVTDFAGFRPVVFKHGVDWRKIDFLPGTALVSEDIQDTEHGLMYSYAGVFKIHRLSVLESREISRYFGQKTVFKITDLNGIEMIIGSPISPCEFLQKGSTGSKPTDMNHKEYTVSVSQMHGYV